HAIVIGMLTLNPKLMDLLQNWRGADGQTINFEEHFKNLEKVFCKWRSNSELVEFLFRLKNLLHKLATNKKEDILEIYTPSLAAIKFLLPYVSSYLTAPDRFEILLEAVKHAAKSKDTHFLRFLLDGSNCGDIFTPNTPYTQYYGFAELGFVKLNNAALCENNFEVARLLIEWRGPNGEWTDIVTKQYLIFSHLEDHLTCRDTQKRKTCIEYIKLLLDWRGGPERKRVFTDDRLNHTILSATIKMRDDKDCEELLEYLLRWRGPNEEFFDPRLHHDEGSLFSYHNYNLLLKAYKYDNIKAFNRLLNWRGPKEECFDINQHVESIFFTIAFCGDRGIKFWQPLLDWRGPKGETIDLTSNAFFYPLERRLSDYRKTPLKLFKHLLSWQDQNGRYFDPTLHNNSLLSAAVSGNHLEVIHLILNWKPPTNLQTRNSESHFSFKEARNKYLPYQKEKENRAVSSFEDTSNMIESELIVKSNVKVDIASSCILL
ncbi:MAG: hypothetical protein VX777_07775, partial [Chlamydiota bacterium]|nr:hypothetical protein [Chlamydiota bacterium]